MRKLSLLMLALGVLALALTACGDDPPPTQIYVVVTATPAMDADTPQTPVADDVDAGAAATATGAPPDTPPSDTPPPDTPPSDTPPPADTAPPRPSATPRPQPTAPPDIFPTRTTAEVAIAEQVFQGGRMFWIRHNRQIWVMLADPDNANQGDWLCYNDTFTDGEMEVDPSLTPPASDAQLYQPRRGFGKLWRNNPEIQNRLGWGITPEFELTSHYVYIPGGYVDGDQYFPGPGEHRLTTLYNESISFFEGDIRGDCQGGTWSLTPAQ